MAYFVDGLVSTHTQRLSHTQAEYPNPHSHTTTTDWAITASCQKGCGYEAPCPPLLTRSRKYNLLAAQIRIIKQQLRAQPLGLQDQSIAVHTMNCQLVGHNIHFASHAADLAKQHLTPKHYKWAKALHRAAATERHQVHSGAHQWNPKAPPFVP